MRRGHHCKLWLYELVGHFSLQTVEACSTNHPQSPSTSPPPPLPSGTSLSGATRSIRHIFDEDIAPRLAARPDLFPASETPAHLTACTLSGTWVVFTGCHACVVECAVGRASAVVSFQHVVRMRLCLILLVDNADQTCSDGPDLLSLQSPVIPATYT